MYRRPSRRSSGGGRGQPPQQPQNPYFPLQNPINTTYVYPSNPPFIPHNAYQNPYQIFPPSNFPTQTPNFSRQNPGFTPPSQQVSSSAVFQPQNSRDMLESIDRAVGKARHELAAAGENVSAWKVAQSTLLMLKVDSWDCLGFQMQQVPSLNVLMLTEAKINAFIHCFIGVQSITSLYDLEVAICKNERIKQFEDLGLGPLLRHPLVLHYFSVKSDTTKVYKITSGDITSLLSEFMDTSKNKMFSPEEILDFIVMKRSAASKEDLGIRIHSVENYISAIRKAKSLEKKSVKGFEKKIDAISMNSAISMLPNEVSNLLEDELSVDDNLKLIITHWKEACRERTVTEVLEMMLQYNNTKARKKKEIKKIKSMLSLYPLSGLLKVAVLSIKCGMWDIMCDTFQTGSLVDNCPEYVSIDVEQITKDEPKMKDPRVITEHILEHTQNCSFKAALLDWALPYAQRYLHGVHPDKYSQLKQSEFEMLNRLQVVVVEKLFYRNVIKGTGSESKMQVECSCLLTGSVLYATQESDSHALFMELSRLFFNGSSELHLANFLHMITTMAQSGSNEEQREFFILNSQKVPKLPDGESVWSLSSLHSLTRSDKPLQTSSTSTEVKEQSSWKSKSKAATWPPVDWKTAPGFGYARANYFKTQAPGSLAVQNKLGDDSEGISRQTDVRTFV